MDNSFMVAGIESAFNGVSQILRWVPNSSLRRFLESKDRLHQVSSSHLLHRAVYVLILRSME